ncbi:MAG: hypothetical protein Q8O76_01140, partial [Chloroflexota bacterium]|nr:hypothetical protein [Chloroflexota bacterium]
MAGEAQSKQQEIEQGSAPKGAAKSTEAAKRVSQLIRDFYKRAQEAAHEGRPVAWCKVGFPQEPLVAMGITSVFPENYSTICAAKRANLPFLERAEGDGYANYICS